MTNREQNIKLLKTRLMQNGIFKQFQYYLENTDDIINLYVHYDFINDTIEEIYGNSDCHLKLDDDPNSMKQFIDHVLDDMYALMNF